VDDFCKAHLPKEDTALARSSAHKIIADPVEGYSSIDPWEVSILDTPLFQRLRGIRQLGLAYLVYPTLGYSRFEHVLGVRARLDEVVTTLRQNQLLRGQAGASLPTEKQLIRMRLAVLSHDFGHCLFSHVSESIVETLPGNENYPSAPLIMSAFKSWAGRRIPMAEILSVAILTSPSFIDYLDRIGMPEAGGHEAAEKIAFEAAHLIVGLPIPGNADSLFLAQLMNSGLDIDKLDYMLREALLSGITLGISLQWLMKKLFIASLPGNQLPSGLLSRLKGFNLEEQFAVLALERGGQFAFEEICVARLALHEKIYLHHKIRAA
jgi:HD superfamily phosphohydrolase